MGFFNDLGGILGLTSQGSNWQAQGISPYDLQRSRAQTQGMIGQQQNFVNALQPQFQQGMQGQTALNQALLQQMQGGGPNPAQAALNQQTGTNIANQAALMASQRGASRSPASVARMAAQQGANLQQQAVGQSALMQAQQQLAAQKQLQDLSASQVGQTQLGLGQLGEMGLKSQGLDVSMLQNQNTTNAGTQMAGAERGAKGIGGLFNAIGGMLFNQGGEVPKTAMEAAGRLLQGAGQGWAGTQNTGPSYKNATVYNVYHEDHYKGGMAGDHFNQMSKIYHGKPLPMKEGGQVPGKPLVNYDSPKNDVVVAHLTPKEIVLPLSVTQSDNPPAEAAKFVEAILAKKGNPKLEENEFKMALKEAIKSRKK